MPVTGSAVRLGRRLRVPAHILPLTVQNQVHVQGVLPVIPPPPLLKESEVAVEQLAQHLFVLGEYGSVPDDAPRHLLNDVLPHAHAVLPLVVREEEKDLVPEAEERAAGVTAEVLSELLPGVAAVREEGAGVRVHHAGV